MRRRRQLLFRLVGALIMVGGPLIGDIASAQAPRPPEATLLIDKALNYLEKAQDERFGAVCLVGHAFFKAGCDLSHPKIQVAIDRCRRDATRMDRDLDQERTYNYDLGLAIIFLCGIGPDKYRREIQRFLEVIQRRQQPGGAWSYPGEPKGDTSQTQYAVLGSWTAHRSGIPVTQDSIERVCNWLIRTQDVDGGWCYHAVDPGEGNYARIKQGPEITHSLTAAGLGSLYLTADLLGFAAKASRPTDADLPPAVKEVQEPGRGPGPVTDKVPRELLMRAIADGNRWFERNYQLRIPRHNFYYLYSFERYKSFQELFERQEVGTPAWYNDGLAFLRQIQSVDGSWACYVGEGAPVDTAFCVLFLARSAKQTIAQTIAEYSISEGVLRGGRGLPNDTSDVSLKDGEVVRPPIVGQLEDLLAILEDPNHPDFDDLAAYAGRLSLDQDPAVRSREIDRLVRLVSQGEWGARKLAVRTLARTGQLSNVPILIYALSDPDLRVMREARDGLCFLSRKLQGFPLPDQPNESQRREAIEQWKKWYREICPGASFFN